MAADRKRRQEIADLIKAQGTDLSSLNDEELQNRLSMMQEFGVGTGNLVDQSKFSQAVAESGRSYGLTTGFEGDKNVVANIISDLAIRLGRYPTAEEIRDNTTEERVREYANLPSGFDKNVPIYIQDIPEFQNFINDQKIRNQLGSQLSGGSFDAFGVNEQDLKDLQDLVGDRTRLAEGTRDIEGFVASLPDELARGRDEFIGSQLESGQQALQEQLFPRIRANVNARGGLFSGDLESELSREAAGVFGDVQSSALSLLQSDIDFYADAAYQQTLQQELTAGGNVQGQIDFARNQATQNQANAFTRVQSDLASSFNNRIFQRESERQLKLQNEAIKRQNESINSQRESQLVGDIVGGVANIGGAALGSKLAKGVVSGKSKGTVS